MAPLDGVEDLCRTTTGATVVEKYVVSPTLAEKLKASGYPQTPQYFYYIAGVLMYNVNKYELSTQAVVAPLSDELLEQMPDWAASVKEGSYADVSPDKKYSAQRIAEFPVYYAAKPADALAELWLWYKKYGHINEL